MLHELNGALHDGNILTLLTKNIKYYTYDNGRISVYVSIM